MKWEIGTVLAADDDGRYYAAIRRREEVTDGYGPWLLSVVFMRPEIRTVVDYANSLPEAKKKVAKLIKGAK